MIVDEDDLVPIAALQHYSYCPRQCALIHIEQTFDENLYTLRGQAVHAQVDEPESRHERGVRVERALPLWSRRLGLTGRADVVEFDGAGNPYPVEYKHGPRRAKAKAHDEIQLAAQALCLEEMTGKPVPLGAIYHHSSRRRREVAMTPALREAVATITAAVRAMLHSGRLPPPAADDRCRFCSLLDACQPHAVQATARFRQLHGALYDAQEDET